MKYFTISEMLYSQTAVQKRIWNGANKQAEENLKRLVETVLDPLRKAYGKPITVTSGYRNKDVNRMVGGVSTSQHTTGCAADISGKSKSENRLLMEMIVKLNLPFDQCIDEKGFQWVHVSVSDGTKMPRKQLLRYDGFKYKTITASEI